MIHIIDKKDCCGCEACVQACPKRCISMQEDSEGFLYPFVDMSICVDCHICENVCPVLNINHSRKPVEVYAAVNKDEQIRAESSSGGAFSAFAHYVIQNGGVVFGAKFDDNWNVVHDYTERENGLAEFRGSKYVQSRIGHSYKDVKNFLEKGRLVLFTGTPCQISGLIKFLKTPHKNLYTIDFVCHGVPSPRFWEYYLTEQQRKKKSHYLDLNKIEKINFRDKSSGWKNYSVHIRFNKGNSVIDFREPMTKNLYIRSFMKNLTLRQSCYYCPVKKLRSNSDITIGDFWNIGLYNKELDDNKGLSLIIINTEKGNNLYKMATSSLSVWPIKHYEYKKNFALTSSVIKPKEREHFFASLSQSNVDNVISYFTKEPVAVKIKNIFNRIKNRIKI